jgi:integrase
MRSRSSAGESTIHRDVVGRWHGYVSMGVKDGGRRDRRHVSGMRRPDVVKRVRELERKRDAGIANAAGQPVTVGAWLEHWVEAIAARKVRPKTLAGYRSTVRLHLTPALGHHRLDRLQPEHVEELYARLSSYLAPATVLLTHRVLSRSLKVAVQRGRVNRNVCALVDAPALRRAEVAPLTSSEARTVLAAATGLRNGARWSVALALGLRQGEALGLRWADVDLDQQTLTVRQALQRQPGKGLVLVPPKSAAGRRTIALPAPLARALREHRTTQSAERAAAGSEWRDLNLVFAQPSGSPIDPSADHRAWKSLLADIGIRPARLHDARHTAATLLLQQGVPARVAMQVLGHSQISLTLGTYSHVVPELAEAAAESMAAALWATTKDAVATKVAPPTETAGGWQ